MENLLNLLETIVFRVGADEEVVPLTSASRALLETLEGSRLEALFGCSSYAELTRHPGGITSVAAKTGATPVKWEFAPAEGGLLCAGVGWTRSDELVERLTRETLLFKEQILNLLPRSAFETLLQRRAVQPKAYRDCTVLFIDIVSFTEISTHIDPVTLLKKLDQHFSAFDEAIQAFGVVKIKTITDSYIAASGVPHRSRGHAVNAALAALHILSALEKRRAKERIVEGVDLDNWSLRVGLHSGPCISGLIGSSRIVFDVWGDAIDLAWRVQEVGEPKRVTVSGATHQLVSAFFETKPAGTLRVERRDPIELFVVERLRPELAEDAQGLVPNARFREQYYEDFTADNGPSSTTSLPPPYLLPGSE